ncbi:hypothetical protein O9K51_09115 [Purpureocillium lavendulum]|uniref:Uncharacterized protein n=1 Tax=Purpureocillium lavendulum TaxID=1247861 RepID=A0AB34FHP4_9HYPO|nr:hypothetical protein O9K51_09115 [Purpureocillium lavendulum]
MDRLSIHFAQFRYNNGTQMLFPYIEDDTGHDSWLIYMDAQRNIVRQDWVRDISKKHGFYKLHYMGYMDVDNLPAFYDTCKKIVALHDGRERKSADLTSETWDSALNCGICHDASISKLRRRFNAHM